jgi:hypothetical protein
MTLQAATMKTHSMASLGFTQKYKHGTDQQ